MKLTEKASLLGLVGVLSEPEAGEIKVSIAEGRKRMWEGMGHTAGRIR